MEAVEQVNSAGEVGVVGKGDINDISGEMGIDLNRIETVSLTLWYRCGFDPVIFIGFVDVI